MGNRHPKKVDGSLFWAGFIFRGMKGNRVLLADPAWGNRTLLVKQFEDAWINFPEIGKVGFVVVRANSVSTPGLCNIFNIPPVSINIIATAIKEFKRIVFDIVVRILNFGTQLLPGGKFLIL